MKVLNLQCAHGHGFEGWFASHEEFERQLTAGLVECPLCGDRKITKLLAAPRLNLGSAKPAEPRAPSDEAESPEGRWLQAVRKVIAQTEDVGDRFADEARKMHYGEAEERGIRGQTTREQAQSLIDEGIPVFSLPLPPALKETLQ
ncbi:hypothetical protein VAR608DRAFT_4786 [Variovorax sp. HW608]|uniref:DUF1178 family protein n=1 Tax=Variovorax sp. HW608 TaxID=1034889 RepID=UPI00081FE325|nr:DUF1178 family protein [Variovorax sp. HW608]SCK48275.1 hypothetical protein VAR608DRAFT_4786 [Variovorax sp. HW608]